MKNEMKLIMESWRKNLKENPERSEGGNILTGSELDQIKSIDLKSGLEAIKNQLKNTIEKNKSEIEKLKKEGDETLVREFIGASVYAALQVPALVISLTQLAGKGAVYVAKKFGSGPTDPNSEYFNDFHKNVDGVLDWVKRQFQSVGIHAVLQGVLKFIYRTDQEKYKKSMENLNLIMDALIFVISLSMMYQKYDKIKEAANLGKIKAAFGNTSAVKTVFDTIDASAGIKDLMMNVVKKFSAA